MKQQVIQEECMIWILVADVYGYIVQFRPYQDAKKGKQEKTLFCGLTPTFSFVIYG